MKISNLKTISAALAGVFALALIGCGSNATKTVGAGPSGPGDPQAPAVTPPAEISVPKVKYNFFEPTREEELVTESNYGYLIAKAKLDFDEARFGKHGLKVVGSFTAGGARYFHLCKEGGNVLRAMNAAKKMSGLMYIEPEIMHHTTDILDPDPIDYDHPDPLVLTTQYGVRVTKTLDAWTTYGFGPNKPVVCDVDTGVSYFHYELAGVVKHAFTWYGTNGTTVLPGQSPAADPDPNDWLVMYPTADPSGSNYRGTDGGTSGGHGTHTAGTICALGNNDQAVAGMCWEIDLVSYKGLDDSGSGGSWPVYGSLWHLAKWKATNYPHTIPVNMSLGSLWASQFAVDMITLGLENGILVCASAGNSYTGAVSYPGSYLGTIRVGSSDAMDRKSSFSQYGPDMSVMAPGSGVQSLSRGRSWATTSMNGTSMACPHVTGLVGYMLTWAPDLTPDQIKTYIEQNADPVGGQIGFSNMYGWGRINTLKTIKAVIDDVNAGVTPPSNYVNSPIRVNVSNVSFGDVFPLNDANVYLYHCTPDGTIQNYAGLSISGTSFLDLPNVEDGVAYFTMLKPGFYKVAASVYFVDLNTGDYEFEGAYSPIFEVKHGGTVDPIDLQFEKDLLYIQTHPTSNTAAQGIDTEIMVYSAANTGSEIAYYDYDYYDTLITLYPTAPVDLWLCIRGYDNTAGEYAFCVTADPTLMSYPAPGTWAAPGPDGMLSTRQTAIGSAQPIDMDQVYYSQITGAANRSQYYRFHVN